MTRQKTVSPSAIARRDYCQDRVAAYRRLVQSYGDNSAVQGLQFWLGELEKAESRT